MMSYFNYVRRLKKWLALTRSGRPAFQPAPDIAFREPRRLFITCVATSILTAFLLALAAAPSAIAGNRAFQKPNFIVIMTDDQDDMGSLSTMPNIQRSLIEAGTRFTNSFVNISSCLQSRMSFLTGQDVHNRAPGGYGTFALREDNSLGVWLQQAGYSTALMGKFLNFYGSIAATHVVPGWSEWHAGVSEGGYFNYTQNVNGVITSYGSNSEDYETDVLARKGIAFITEQAARSSPFFLLLTPHAPHTHPTSPPAPVPAPRHAGHFSDLALPRTPNFNEPNVTDKPGLIAARPTVDSSALAWYTFEFRKRRETLLAVDEMVGSILRVLRANNLDSNTYIIFTSDNGWSQASHRWRGKNMPYEEPMHVPLIVRGPGVPINQVRTQIVINLDLTATILELAGAVPGNIIDGRSLVPLLKPSPFTNWRSGFFFQGGYSLDEIENDGQRITSVRARNFIYSRWSSKQYGIEEELYDLVNDPYQMLNRARDSRCVAVLTFLRAARNSLSSCSGISCWMTAEPPPSCP